MIAAGAILCHWKTAEFTRFITDIMLSAPSIVLGLFVYAIAVATVSQGSYDPVTGDWDVGDLASGQDVLVPDHLGRVQRQSGRQAVRDDCRSRCGRNLDLIQVDAKLTIRRGAGGLQRVAISTEVLIEDDVTPVNVAVRGLRGLVSLGESARHHHRANGQECDPDSRKPTNLELTHAPPLFPERCDTTAHSERAAPVTMAHTHAEHKGKRTSSPFFVTEWRRTYASLSP